MRVAARGVGIGFAALLLVLATPVPAGAKIPPFTVEWSPQAPPAGETVRFTVRFWDDLRHTDRAARPDLETFEDFLWAFPASRAPADAIPIDVVLVRRGVYRGEAVLPTPGAWSVYAWETSCPIGDDAPAYPGRLTLRVAAVAAGALGARRLRRRSPAR